MDHTPNRDEMPPPATTGVGTPASSVSNSRDKRSFYAQLLGGHISGHRLFPHDVWTVVFCFLLPKAVLACAGTCRSVAASATSASVWVTIDLQYSWRYANSMPTEHQGLHPLDVFRAKREFEKETGDFRFSQVISQVRVGEWDWNDAMSEAIVYFDE